MCSQSAQCHPIPPTTIITCGLLAWAPSSPPPPLAERRHVCDVVATDGAAAGWRRPRPHADQDQMRCASISCSKWAQPQREICCTTTKAVPGRRPAAGRVVCVCAGGGWQCRCVWQLTIQGGSVFLERVSELNFGNVVQATLLLLGRMTWPVHPHVRVWPHSAGPVMGSSDRPFPPQPTKGR